MSNPEIIRRRNLPHRDVPSAAYFVTVCLEGSIPARGLLDLPSYRAEPEQRPRPADQTPADWAIVQWKRAFARTERWLDRAEAVRFLENDELAQIVVDALYFFAGERYDLLGYVVMPNHFHLAVWPEGDRHLSTWMHWLMTAHVRAYRKQYQGSGPIWQARFKALPIQEDDHLLTVLRDIECHPLRAAFVAQAQDWTWSSLRARLLPPLFPLLHRGPVPVPAAWADHVHAVLHDKDLKRLGQSVRRGTPFGQESWVEASARPLGLEDTRRPPGRPRNSPRATDGRPAATPTLFS